MHVAFCDASGVIGFAQARGVRPRIPKGMLAIGYGNKSAMSALRACSRLAYDGKTYLVPGVPEAPDQLSGVDALMKFQEWLVSRKIVSR